MEGYISIEEHKQILTDSLAKSEKESKEKIADLTFRLEQLTRMLFGAKSERFIRHDGDKLSPDQLNLFAEFTELSKKLAEINGDSKEESSTGLATIAAHQRKVKLKKKPARLVLPEHLRREEIIIEPEERTEEMVKLGEERTEQIIYTPAELYVKVTIRTKYVLPPIEPPIEGKVYDLASVSPVHIAPLPERFIDRCMAHPSLLAHIITDKYVDHIPLYRTINRIKRLCGLTLPKSTVSGWVRQSAARLNILYQTLIQIVLARDYLMVDETRMEVMPNSPPPEEDYKKNRRPSKRKSKFKAKKVKRKTERGWLWAYHAPDIKLTFFDYDPSRGTLNPAHHLKDFDGTVQSDGWRVYDIIGKVFPNLEHYYCLVHARRKFEAALKNDKKRAEHVLLVFQQIYALERIAKDNNWTDEQLLQQRQEQAAPILEKLFDWMEVEFNKVDPKESIGKAMTYMMKRKKGLLHYLYNPKFKPDTNLVENAIRPVAVGRKNYLFAGSHNAAQWAAIFYSFFACCKVNNINPYEWLLDVMLRINDHSVQNLEELLPHKWTKTDT